MKAVILAAGRGSRLKELTNDKPKGLVKLMGKSLAARMIDSLRQAGVNEIAIITGYRSEDFKKLGLPMFYNAYWKTTNMVLSLMAARSWLTLGDVLVCYSDIFVSSEDIKKLMKANGNLCVMYDPNWLSLWKERNEDPLIDAETFKLDGSRIIEIGQKPSAINEIEGQYMGLLKFTAYGWEAFEKEVLGLSKEVAQKISMTEVLQGMVTGGFDIQAVKLDGLWGEVDTPSDLKLYEQKAKSGTYKGWF